MIGYLTLPWVMTSELYPLRFRGPLGGITTSMAQLLTFATIKMYPDLSAVIGIETTMWMFAGASILGALFALTILPETRGRSLDQIEGAFSGKVEWNDPAQTLPTVVAQSRSVTLQKFATISEEKQSNILANAYTYDNFCIDLSQDETAKSGRNASAKSDVIPTISLEHVYL